MNRDDRKRAIGTVVSVAADRFVVEMHAGTDNFTVVGFDDVHYVARLGSFLMIPVQTDYVVAEIIGLREKDIAQPRGDKEMDKASSAKFLDVVPVGMLPQNRAEKFRFGVSVFPSLYADALYALDGELDRVLKPTRLASPLRRSAGCLRHPRTQPGIERLRSASPWSSRAIRSKCASTISSVDTRPFWAIPAAGNHAPSRPYCNRCLKSPMSITLVGQHSSFLT